MNKKQIVMGSLAGLFGMAAIVIIVISLSAMSANRLACSSNNSSNGTRIEQRYEIKYDKDIVKSVSITKIFAYSDQKQFDAFKSVVIPGNDSKMNELKNDHISYTSSVNDKTYNTSTKISLDNATKTEIDSVGIDKSLKTLKSNLESQGLVCR
jgi:hypothetical protein